MKKSFLGIRITAFLLIVLLSASILTVTADNDPVNSADPDSGSVKTSEMRGVWVATVLNIDYPSSAATDPEALKNEALKVLDNVKAIGFNAVFLQVRPASDAIYNSQYFPWSKYLTGTQGVAPEDGFDPLEFWVTEAHKRGIELHAWINPYRITKIKVGEAKYDFNSLASSNPARLHPEWVVKYSDGNLYYNPGIPEVRRLIMDGVLEIVNNYDVDGIHFDDYFYPGSNFDDAATYAVYGAGFSNIDDWRRENVNTLIRDLSSMLKATGRNIRFGISPFGIWANKDENSLGSDTKGSQSYSNHYADSRRWVKEGIIDYIAPQIYWNIGFTIADYSKLLNWWKDTVSGTGVDLYIGQAAYRCGNSSPSSAWYGVSEIEKQLKLNTNTEGIKGSIFYTYNSFENEPALGSVVKAIFEQRDNAAEVGAVSVSRPAGNIRTGYKQYYLNGSSDPQKPLYLNGKLVENRSSLGYFGVLVPLETGANVFTLSQEAAYTSFVIYKEASSASLQKMDKADIPSTSVFPQSQEYRVSGEKITLSCQAPVNAKVTVKLGGKTLAMKPADTASSGSGIYATTYTYVYTVPSYNGSPRNINIGKPVYTMKYKGITKTTNAPADIGVIKKGSPYYAEVLKDTIDTYNSPVTSNGAAFELYKGMTENITGMTKGYVRLSSGQWVKNSDVKVYSLKYGWRPVITKAVYQVGNKWDKLVLDIKAASSAYASFEGNTLKFSVSSSISAGLPVLPDNSLFSSVKVAKNDDRTEYNLQLKEGQRIEGYYVEKTATGLVLNIKRHIKADVVNGALSGITIMVDPGHGGSDSGAVGPAGLIYPEKAINLDTALKLRDELAAMGAKVIMTRVDDTALSLAERLALSRSAKPDMFISIHSNSAEDNVDISKISGFSAFYRNSTADILTKAIYENVTGSLNRNDMGVKVKNFYVIRGSWAPSLLLEGGFVPNPGEFEWLSDPNEQTLYAQSIANAIAGYFAN